MTPGKLFLIAMLVSRAALAGPSFVPGDGGEVVSDLELDLSTLPAFTWVADPFLKVPGRSRAPASTSADEVEYKLQATTIEGEEAVAVVNDRVVRVGDRVGRRTVMKIGQDFVLLGDRGSVIEANLEAPVEKDQGSPQSREPAQAKTKVSEPEGQIRIEELKK